MWSLSSIKCSRTDGWQASEIEALDVVHKNNIAVYRGSALEAAPEALGKTLQFSISTTSLKPAKVGITIATTGAVRVQPEITDDRTQRTFSLPTTMTCPTIDLIPAAES